MIGDPSLKCFCVPVDVVCAQVMLSSHANAKPAVTWTLPLQSSKIKDAAMLLLKYVAL